MRSTFHHRLLATTVAITVGLFLPACGCSSQPDEGVEAVADVAPLSIDTAPPAVDTFVADDTQPKDSQVSDTLTQDSGNGDTSQVSDGNTIKLPDYCKADLPMPGESCSKLDESRCTNHGAQVAMWSAAQGTCDRPYYVACKPDGKGGLVWKLAECPGASGLGKAKEALKCEGTVTCLVEGGIDRGCRPLLIKLVGGKAARTLKQGAKPVPATVGLALRACLSTSQQKEFTPGGLPVCSNDAVLRCLSLDDMGPLKDGYITAAGGCAKHLSSGHWVFPLEACPSNQIACSPKSKKCILPSNKGLPECKEYFKLSCYEPNVQTPFYDPNSGEIRCTKDCHEAGAPSY